MPVKDNRGQPPRPDHPFASGPRIIFGGKRPVQVKPVESPTIPPHPAGPSPLLESMKARGEPITLDTWMTLNFPDGVPDPYPGELLDEIPDELWPEVDAFLENQARQRNAAPAPGRKDDDDDNTSGGG